MSAFGDKLRLYIGKSGESVYQLAKRSGVERTSIHKAMSGSRILNQDGFDRLIELLKLTPAEKQDLADSYEIAKQGEDVYHRRRKIAAMLNSLAALPSREFNTPVAGFKVDMGSRSFGQIELIRGKYEIYNLMRTAVLEEISDQDVPTVCTNIRFSDQFMADTTSLIYMSTGGKLTIKHILRFARHSDFASGNYNMDRLSEVLPMVLYVGDGYKPYYFYGDYDSANDITLLAPYYIITRKRIITVSADYQRAAAFSDPEIVRLCQESFDMSIKRCQPLISCLNNSIEAINYQKEYESCINQPLYKFEAIPCLAMFFSSPLINRKIRPDAPNREELVRSMCARCDAIRAVPSMNIMFFSEYGINYFTDTGMLFDVPPDIVLPFTAQERLKLLQELKRSVACGNNKAVAVNPERLNISNRISISCCETGGILFSGYNGESGSYVILLLKEEDIVKSISDFMAYLPQSDLVLNPHQSAAIIDGCIKRLKSTL